MKLRRLCWYSSWQRHCTEHIRTTKTSCHRIHPATIKCGLPAPLRSIVSSSSTTQEPTNRHSIFRPKPKLANRTFYRMQSSMRFVCIMLIDQIEPSPPPNPNPPHVHPFAENILQQSAHKLPSLWITLRGAQSTSESEPIFSLPVAASVAAFRQRTAGHKHRTTASELLVPNSGQKMPAMANYVYTHNTITMCTFNRNTADELSTPHNVCIVYTLGRFDHRESDEQRRPVERDDAN